MLTVVNAGTVYFATVFLVGFALGTVRVLVIAPIIGQVPATVLELPIMLIASWLICAWTIRGFAVPSEVGIRCAMGALAFGLLMAAETILGVVAFERTLEQQLATYYQKGSMLGLMAQIAFALIPIVQTVVTSAQQVPPVTRGRMQASNALRGIKLAHTLIWALIAGCILAIPVFTSNGNLSISWVLIAVVTLEVLVIAVNRGHCPLTFMAARYTDDRSDNFDIYLPAWLARYNKAIFGSLFFVALAYTLVEWWRHGAAV